MHIWFKVTKFHSAAGKEEDFSGSCRPIRLLCDAHAGKRGEQTSGSDTSQAIVNIARNPSNVLYFFFIYKMLTISCFFSNMYNFCKAISGNVHLKHVSYLVLFPASKRLKIIFIYSTDMTAALARVKKIRTYRGLFTVKHWNRHWSHETVAFLQTRSIPAALCIEEVRLHSPLENLHTPGTVTS